MESKQAIGTRASDLIAFVFDDEFNAYEHLTLETMSLIKSVQTEKSAKLADVSSRSTGDRERGERSGKSSFSRSENVREHRTTIKKPVLKKKATSFDDAMKQKITTELNKISPTNYEAIVKSIDNIYSRLSDDEHIWALRLIIENATKQHIFAVQYVNLYKDIVKKNPKDIEIAKSLLIEMMDSHKETILQNVDNGSSYDDFCEANKQKVSSIGLSIFLGEAVNNDMIKPDAVAKHAMSMLDTLKEIREQSKTVSRETTETSINCVLEFFKIVSKTKLEKEGFKSCIVKIQDFLDDEQKLKIISMKAKFAIMDFIEEIKKRTEALPPKSSEGVYRPSFRRSS